MGVGVPGFWEYGRAILKSYRLPSSGDGIRLDGWNDIFAALRAVFNAGNLRNDHCAPAGDELSSPARRRFPHGRESPHPGEFKKGGDSWNDKVLPNRLFLLCPAGFGRRRVLHAWIFPDADGVECPTAADFFPGIGAGRRT